MLSWCGAVIAFVRLAKRKLGGRTRKWTLTLHLLTNPSAFSTFTPDQSFNKARITKTQYVRRRSMPPPVGSEVKVRGQLVQQPSVEVGTNLPSSFWLDFRKATRPCRSKRVKSSRRIARVIEAAYVTIICSALNSDSYVFWWKAGASGR